MSNDEFSVAVRHWMGLSVIPSGVRDRLLCACSRNVSLSDEHVFSCPVQRGPTARHNHLVGEVREMAEAVGLHTQLEPRGFPGIDCDSGPDIDIADFHGFQRPVCVDVTVVDPLAPSREKRAAAVALTTALTAERDKTSKYKEVLRLANRGFIPFAMEVTGGLAPCAVELLRTCAKRHKELTPDRPFSTYSDSWTARTFCDYWLQRLAVALRKGNALVVSRALSAAQACNR